MGYTHYWRHKQDFTPSEWEQVEEDFAAICHQAKAEDNTLKLSDGSGEPDKHPNMDGTRISVNGVDEESHESFIITRLRRLPYKYELDPDDRDLLEEGMFDFCKTAHKPYDVVVTATLWYLANKYPEHLTISSDGGYEMWRPGISLASTVVDGLPVSKARFTELLDEE